MRWDYPPPDINPVFPGLGVIIIVIVIVIIITIIYYYYDYYYQYYFFKVDFYITFYNYKEPINFSLLRKLEKNSDTKRFANSFLCQYQPFNGEKMKKENKIHLLCNI